MPVGIRLGMNSTDPGSRRLINRHREQAHSYRGTHFKCRIEPARDRASSNYIKLSRRPRLQTQMRLFPRRQMQAVRPARRRFDTDKLGHFIPAHAQQRP